MQSKLNFSKPKLWTWCGLGLLLIVATVMRLPHAISFGMWGDEIYVRDMALSSMNRMLVTWHFAHFLPVRFCLWISDTELGLRFTSFVAGLISILLAYNTGRHLWGKKLGWTCAIVATVVPYFCYYAVDGNYYSQMMMWTWATLALIVSILRHNKIYSLLLLFVISLFSLWVHPFSLLFYVGLFPPLCIHYLMKRVNVRLEKTDHPRAKAIAIEILMLVGLVLCIALVIFGISYVTKENTIIVILSRALKSIDTDSSLQGAGYSFDYLKRFFQQISTGPFIYATRLFYQLPLLGKLVPIYSNLIFIVFCLGVILSGRRHPMYPILILSPIICGFVIINNASANHIFARRYFSFMVPIYWLSVSIGIVGSGELIAYWGRKALKGRPVRKFVYGFGQVASLVLLGLVIAQGMWIESLVRDGDYRHWTQVSALITAEEEADNLRKSPIYFSWCDEGVPFLHYARGWRENGYHSQLIYDKQLHLPGIKAICLKNEKAWFVFQRGAGVPDEVYQWCDDNMTQASSLASYYNIRHNLKIYYWDKGSRYISPPRHTDYTFPADSDFRDLQFDVVSEREHPTEIKLQLTGDKDRLLGDGNTCSLEFNGEPLKTKFIYSQNKGAFYAEHLLPKGVGSYRLRMHDPAIKVEQVSWWPHWPGRVIEMYPEQSEVTWPEGTMSIEKNKAEKILRLSRRAYTSYSFSVDIPSRYWFGLEACNDAANIVLFEVILDGKSRGVLSFDEQNNQFSEKGFPVYANRGEHTLEIQFINETRKSEDWIAGGDKRIEGRVRGIRLRPATAKLIRRDERVVVLDKVKPTPVEFAIDDDMQLASGWHLVTSENEEFDYTITRDEENGDQVLSMEIDPKSKGFMLLSPQMVFLTNRVAYYSAAFRLQTVNNHDVNIRTYYYDENGELIAENAAYMLGLSRTCDWTRLMELQRAMPEAKTYSIAIWVYPNGHRTSRTTGRISVRNPVVESF